MKEMPKHAKDESYIAFGGPFLGTIATFAAFLLYVWTHQPLWGLSVYIGAILNLFNLIPITPLDGGRIVTAISPKIWIIGLVILGISGYFIPGPILFLIFVLGVIQVMTHFREPYRYRLDQVFINRLKRRKKAILAFSECEDIYEKNQKIFIDQKRREGIDDRISRLKANRRLSSRFHRLRVYIFEIEREVLRHTWLDEEDNSVRWLDQMIETKKKRWRK
ncbi:site-2 protease family protein [Terrilactibacillus sp. S3-3]|nr:site-2 protease family protein [Terrilactibacillus sp. S3-3]